MARRLKLNKDNDNKKGCTLDSNAKNRCNKFLNKAKLAMYMKQGLDIKDAAKLCNINDYQLGLLRSDPEFEELIEYCGANCEFTHLKNIEEAGTMGAWQASAWVLERKFPDKYGKRDTIKHEYEVKLMSFQKVVLNVINELDPNIRQIIMQKLRNYNVDEQVDAINMGQLTVESK
jgi:hypothetical protein